MTRKDQYVMLMIGISGSGKTTLAQELIKANKSNPRGLININRDDLRFSLFGCKSWEDYKFTKGKERVITDTQFVLAEQAIERGDNVIISDTNLSPKTRNKWKEFCKRQKVTYLEQALHVDLATCQKRNAARPNGVSPSLINEQWVRFNEQFGHRYKPNETRRKAIIVDIDGTLAHMQGRSPYAWDRVDEDTIDTEVRRYVQSAYLAEIRVIILSGRDGSCEAITRSWLLRNDVPYDHFYMREAGDQRPDTVVKRELFDQHIRDQYNVILAIDDRPCMVSMWNDMGIKTWAVADQRIEF